jgi:protocatechuate 3,4-dioxygenase beta subunit
MKYLQLKAPMLKNMRLFALVTVVAAVAVAQQASQPAADKKPIRLEGRVVGLNGAPVRKANVHLQGSGAAAPAQNGPVSTSYLQTTDEAGQFIFDNVAPGRYTLSADKIGFLAARYGARTEGGPAVPLIVAAGDEKKNLEIKMTPQGVVIGRVIDQDGDPIPNAQITVARYEYVGGRRALTPTSAGFSTGGSNADPAAQAAAAQALLGGGAQSTDDQGSFRIANLVPGRYYVSADPRPNRGILGMVGAQGRGGAPAAAGPANVATYYPSALEPRDASPVDVTPGSETRGIDIRVRKENVYSIRGKVVDGASGNLVNGAAILVLPAGAFEPNPAAIMSNMTVAMDGNFEITNLRPGRYGLQGMAFPGLAGGRGAAPAASPLATLPKTTTRIEVGISDSNVTGAVLQLIEGSEMSGIVKMDEGNLKDYLAPAAQPNPQLAALGQGAMNRRVMLTMSEGPNLSVPMGQFAEDGAFKITGVYPAKYWIALGAIPKGTYVKSIRFAGQEVAHAPLDLTTGAAGSLEITLSAKAADLSGTVHDDKGEPLPQISVTLWPKVPDKGSEDGGIHTANTDQNGGFKISGLAPGDYYVAAWDDLPEQGLNQNPDFLLRFAGDQTAVKLSESGHSSMDMKPIPRERIVVEAAKIP